MTPTVKIKMFIRISMYPLKPVFYLQLTYLRFEKKIASIFLLLAFLTIPVSVSLLNASAVTIRNKTFLHCSLNPKITGDRIIERAH
jgi:hypothetical protein